MPEVYIPKDLTQVQNKVMFGLTRRQLVCFSLAAVVSVPIYLLTRKPLGGDAAVKVHATYIVIKGLSHDGVPALLGKRLADFPLI